MRKNLINIIVNSLITLLTELIILFVTSYMTGVLVVFKYELFLFSFIGFIMLITPKRKIGLGILLGSLLFFIVSILGLLYAMSVRGW